VHRPSEQPGEESRTCVRMSSVFVTSTVPYCSSSARMAATPEVLIN
jgi:hypothetical protein